MRAIITFGGNYPETLRSAFETLVESGEVNNLSRADLVDAIESADEGDFAIIDVELVD